MEESPKRIVLIADDDEMFVKLISNEFASQNFETASAANGQEVIDKAAALKPSIILMDMIMPVKDGFEAITEIRSLPDLNNTKIVVLSNLSQEEDINKATQLGANGYLVKKDYSLKDLVGKVLEIAGR